MTSRSWQHISYHCDVCSNHMPSSDFSQNDCVSIHSDLDLSASLSLPPGLSLFLPPFSYLSLSQTYLCHFQQAVHARQLPEASEASILSAVQSEQCTLTVVGLSTHHMHVGMEEMFYQVGFSWAGTPYLSGYPCLFPDAEMIPLFTRIELKSISCFC